ncbi:MAG: Myo-inositol 2-dehydrogenase [Fimbriimonadaceae bacterium]|nr:Myo-inositol 2-dehydrogenase [Fimbriimonadaceae bacterium]
MKVAVVGAGHWGQNHIRTLHQMGALDSVVEVQEAARQRVADEYPGIPVHARLEDADAKAFVVASPAPTHHEIGLALLERGSDVLIEKPITLNVRDAEDLVRTARDQDAILMAGHLLLYQPAIRFVHDAVRSGMIGELRSIHQARLNLGRARAFEDVLWSLGVHDVSVALYWVGQSPTKVAAESHCVLNPDIADDVYLHLSFEGGVKSHLHASWLWPELRRRAVIVGSRAMLVYDELAQTVTLHRKHIDRALANHNDGEEVVFEGAGQPLSLELEHFLDCVKERAKPISDGESALEVLRVLETASKEVVHV